MGLPDLKIPEDNPMSVEKVELGAECEKRDGLLKLEHVESQKHGIFDFDLIPIDDEKRDLMT